MLPWKHVNMGHILLQDIFSSGKLVMCIFLVIIFISFQIQNAIN